MEIILKNDFFLNFFVFLIIPYLVCYRGSILKGYNSDFLSPSNTNSIKGVSAIVVVLSHIAMFTTTGGIFSRVFIKSGFLAVAVFLFVSGYGLMTQLRKKENYLNGFLFGKVFRIFVIFFISNIAVTIVNNIYLGSNYGVREILISSIKFNFSNGRELWFVAAILFLYISFYIAFRFFNRRVGFVFILLAPTLYIIGCILLEKGSWWYNTIICFDVGIIFAVYKDKIYDYYKKNYLIKLIIVTAMFFISMFLYSRGGIILQFIIPIIFIIAITMILLKVKLNSPIINFINKISFEIYLTHLIILQVGFMNKTAKDSIYIIILVAPMLLLALVTHWGGDYILDALGIIANKKGIENELELHQ